MWRASSIQGLRFANNNYHIRCFKTFTTYFHFPGDLAGFGRKTGSWINGGNLNGLTTEQRLNISDFRCLVICDRLLRTKKKKRFTKWPNMGYSNLQRSLHHFSNLVVCNRRALGFVIIPRMKKKRAGSIVFKRLSMHSFIDVSYHELSPIIFFSLSSFSCEPLNL